MTTRAVRRRTWKKERDTIGKTGCFRFIKLDKSTWTSDQVIKKYTSQSISNRFIVLVCELRFIICLSTLQVRDLTQKLKVDRWGRWEWRSTGHPHIFLPFCRGTYKRPSLSYRRCTFQVGFFRNRRVIETINDYYSLYPTPTRTYFGSISIYTCHYNVPSQSFPFNQILDYCPIKNYTTRLKLIFGELQPGLITILL